MPKENKISLDETEFLDLVEHKISNNLKTSDAKIPFAEDILSSASKHLCVDGTAKRARPLLTMLFGDALNLDRAKLINIATAVELIHSASLMHDDVIDNAKTRRGKVATNVQYSNAIAVLAGNFLWSQAFLMLRELPGEITYQAVDAISSMTSAAIAEIEVQGKLNISLDIWRKIAVGKTGVLFSWCGDSVGRLAGDLDSAGKFYRGGCHLGAAFQMADDVRDLTDVQNSKDLYADLRNKEPSYPIILGLNKCDAIRDKIAKLWECRNPHELVIARVGKMLVNEGFAEQTCEAMQNEIDAATDSLGHLITTKGVQDILAWAKILHEKASNGFE